MIHSISVRSCREQSKFHLRNGILEVTRLNDHGVKERGEVVRVVPMTRSRVLAVMLVTTLVATHSHSPWSSLLRDRNCKLPLGRLLCLLLLGFPT